MVEQSTGPDIDTDIPALPAALVELSLLLADEDVNLQAVSELIESDMALASSVLRAVNSAIYGLRGGARSVQQALTYLGLREVMAVTYEIGLRSVFAPAAELEPIWTRAARRGLLMGRMAQRLAADPWAAHSAGLFEECGKAVLLRHAPLHYRAMLRAAADDAELVTLERAGFGIGHDDLGATLCARWGLADATVCCVRHHVDAQSTHEWPQSGPARILCALSALAHSLLTARANLAETAESVAAAAGVDASLIVSTANDVVDQLGARA
jgi:HD-like signal output (HDOD) protein